jgi:hypothetical protein
VSETPALAFFLFFFLLSEGIGQAVRPTARYPCSCFFFFFLSFILDVSITMVGTTISIVIHSPVFTVLCLFPMHSLSSLLYFLHSFFFSKKNSQTMAFYVKPPPHILFTFYFQFILVFGCMVYVVFMGYFVKNLGFYFVMNLFKIPDPIRVTRLTRPKKTRSEPSNTRRFFTFSLLSRVINSHTRLTRVG